MAAMSSMGNYQQINMQQGRFRNAIGMKILLCIHNFDKLDVDNRLFIVVKNMIEANYSQFTALMFP